MATLNRAIEIAAVAHAGQVDKAGAPYILHPLRVMLAVEDTDARIAAVLHDLLEDCPGWTAARLSQEGFAPQTIAAIEGLTRRDGETYEDFVARCALDPIARLVKRADLVDNLDERRITWTRTAADDERLARYRRALVQLDAAGGL